MEIAFNILLSSCCIALVLWISKSNPVLAGFVASLPLSTLIILAMRKLHGGDTGSTTLLAKSIFIGIPSTLVFFVPFLIAEKFKISFWACYFSGFALLGIAYFVHKFLVGYIK